MLIWSKTPLKNINKNIPLKMLDRSTDTITTFIPSKIETLFKQLKKTYTIYQLETKYNFYQVTTEYKIVYRKEQPDMVDCILINER